MKPRAVTGMGIASALGTGGLATLTEPVSSGARPPIKSFDASAYGDLPSVLEVPGFDPTRYLGDKGLRTLDRLTKLLVVAARLALHDAGLKKDNEWVALSAETVGLCCSNAYGSLESITELDRVAVLEDARYINPAKFPNTVSNSAAGYVSIWEELRALNVSVSDGNCGALDVFSCADLFLETGRAEAILTGGGEAMSEALFLAFDKLGLLGPAHTARLGEGAAFLALEPLEKARARAAKILATVNGYGTAYDAAGEEVTLLHPSTDALERAIALALEDARIAAKDVDLVASSVAGIGRHDDAELSAIRRALGDVPVAAPKRSFGETHGAGGVLATSAAIAWLAGAKADCVVSGAAPGRPETVVVTALGYYGNASALVVRRPA
jgi:3-oxoacyl-(acyl-carrier-protein) synthase